MPERIIIQHSTLGEIEKAAKQAALVLAKGGIVLYPTDTLYALGADAENKEALEKIYAIKGRDQNKPLSVLIDTITTAEQYVKVTPLVHQLADLFLPGPLTLVLEKKLTGPDVVAGSGKTLGIRIPNNQFCLTLAGQYHRPITATSANLSGLETLASPEAILPQFGDRAKLIDLVIDAGVLPLSKASTVLAISPTNELQLIRPGAILWEKIIKLAK